MLELVHMPKVLQERPGLVAYSMAIVGYFYLIYLSEVENAGFALHSNTLALTFTILSLKLFPAAFFGLLLCAGSPRAVLHLFRFRAATNGLIDWLLLTACLTAQVLATSFLVIGSLSMVVSFFFFLAYAAQ